MADNKKYIITVDRRGRTKDLEPKTIPELLDYFGYTLEKGRSWQHERGCEKIPKRITDINKLVSALNASERNAAMNGDPATYYSLKSEFVEKAGICDLVNKILEGSDIRQTLAEA